MCEHKAEIRAATEVDVANGLSHIREGYLTRRCRSWKIANPGPTGAGSRRTGRRGSQVLEERADQNRTAFIEHG
jgi:hypothetical protein